MGEVIRCTVCRKVVAERTADGTAVVRHGGRETVIAVRGSTTCPHMTMTGTRGGRQLWSRCPGVTEIVCQQAS